MPSDKMQKRTNQERIESIFDFIEKQPDVFPKSNFKAIGLNPRTAEMWLKIIEYIQSQPRIRLIQTDHNLLVEKVEGKYQALMRRMSLDEAIPFEQRLQHLTDYLKSLYIREKRKENLPLPPTKSKKPILFLEPDEILSQILDTFETLTILDPDIHNYVQMLRDVPPEASSEAKYYALAKWQKSVFLQDKFQEHLEKVLNREYYSPLLGKICRNEPDFMEKLDRAKQTIQNFYAYLKENMADWFLKNGGHP
jgi:hypothetical protein